MTHKVLGRDKPLETFCGIIWLIQCLTLVTAQDKPPSFASVHSKGGISHHICVPGESLIFPFACHETAAHGFHSKD